MSLAIKFGDIDDPSSTSGFVYMDAATQYSRDFKGSVTSHPIGSGGKISDHFIRDNPVYSFTAVISGADISIGREFIVGESGDVPMNVFPDIPEVKIKGTENNLLSLLPDSVSQFFVDAEASVSVSNTRRRDTLVRIRSLLESLFDKDGLSLITLYEYKNNKLDRFIDPLVMTSLSFKEDPDSGLALYISVTLEKILFTSLKTTTLTKKDVASLNSKNVASDLKPAAAPLDNKGAKNSTIPDSIKAPAVIVDNKLKSALVILGGG